MSLEGKIDILNEIIAGSVAPEEIPLEFQGKPVSELIRERDELVSEIHREGPNGEASKEGRARAQETALHMAGHIQIEMHEAMHQHHDFISNGMYGVERLETFSSMLDNDEYWNYLMENEEERNKVRDQHFNGMMSAIETEERSVLDMSDREVILQGEENMHRLHQKEIEVETRDLPQAEREAKAEEMQEQFDAKHGHLLDGKSDSHVERFTENKAAIGTDTASQSEQAAVAQAQKVESLDELDFLMAGIEETAQKFAKENPEPFQSLAAGAYEAEAKTKSQNFSEVSKELAEKTQGGVEETGKSEPDVSLVQDEKPAVDPSLSAS